MSAELLLQASLLVWQIAAAPPVSQPQQGAPALKAAPTRIFKDLREQEPLVAEPIAQQPRTPKPKLVADWGTNSSARRPRSGFIVDNGTDTAPIPSEAGPAVAEGPVLAPQEEAVPPETLGDRTDPAWRGALTAPPAEIPADPRRVPPNTLSQPHGYSQPNNYSQLSHTVRPQQPLPAATTAAGHMVNRWFEPAKEEHSARNELALLDALDGTSDPSDRARIVVAYWQAAAEAAEERCARDEVAWLGTFDAATGGSHLQAAKRAAEAELLAAQLKRDEAAETLARLVPRAGQERYPLPVDLPCVEAYRTHADNLLAGRPDGDEMKRLTRKMPPLLNVVTARAAAVESMEGLQKQMAERHAQATPADVLNAYQELRYQRREFLAAVVAYNTAIARYAFGAADRGLEPSRAVAMLIARPRQTARAPGNRSAAYDQTQIASPVGGELADPVYLR